MDKEIRISKQQLKEIIEQLEACNFECQAGKLVNNVSFKELKEMLNKK